ncbi:MAG: PAS domain S-box protein, partial [Gemmatimonadaceae bacterium]|nr:PAS domain S-box protein [Gemmatimonadaceae bacterium]
MTDARAAALDALEPGSAAALLALAGDVVLVMTRRGIIESVAFGTPDLSIEGHEEWVGRSFADVVGADSRTKAEALLTEVGTKGITRRRQLNHPTPVGADAPVQYVLARLGRSDRLVAVGRDLRTVSSLQQRLIEAQQTMERDYWKLRHIETRYRLLFQLAGDAILVLDAAGLTVLDANQAASTLFGEPVDKLIGRNFPFGVTADDVRLVDEALGAAKATGRANSAVVRLTAGAATTIAATTFRQNAQTLVLVRLTPQRADGDTAARTPTSDLMMQAPDAFVVTDLEGKILLVNAAFLDLSQLATDG